MTGSPSSIIMIGFGNGTFAGSPSLILTLGYGASAVVATLAGSWSLVISCHGNQDRIATHGNQDRVGTHGNQERVEL